MFEEYQVLTNLSLLLKNGLGRILFTRTMSVETVENHAAAMIDAAHDQERLTSNGRWHVRFSVPAFEYLKTTGLGPRNVIAAAVSALPVAGPLLHESDSVLAGDHGTLVTGTVVDVSAFADSRLPFLVESAPLDCYSGTKAANNAARQLNLVYFVVIVQTGCRDAPPAADGHEHQEHDDEHRKRFVTYEQQICVAQICTGRVLASTKAALAAKLQEKITNPRFLWRCLERRSDGRPLRFEVEVGVRRGDEDPSSVNFFSQELECASSVDVVRVLSVTKAYEEWTAGAVGEVNIVDSDVTKNVRAEDHHDLGASRSGEEHLMSDLEEKHLKPENLSEEQTAALERTASGPLFVAGRSGSGKTTMLLHAALRAEKNEKTPILVLTQSALLTRTLRAKYAQLRDREDVVTVTTRTTGTRNNHTVKTIFSSYADFMRNLDAALGRLDGEFFLEENRKRTRKILSLGDRFKRQSGAVSYAEEKEVDFKVG